MHDLTSKKCIPCSGATPKLNSEQIKTFLSMVPDWQANVTNTAIFRLFEFKNYYKTIAFVNAVAWLAHNENHHPDLEVSYASCKVIYTTHAINGLSENDFICAAKIDALA